MIDLTLEELLGVVEGELLAGDPAVSFSGYSTDSRQVQKGQLFIPIVGERFNGNDYIETAYEQGATVCMLSDLSKRPHGVVYDQRALVYVKDSLVALQRMAAYLLMKADIPVVAVTGSTGKTTTKEMIATILEQQYKVLKNEGNLNNHIGLPLTLLKLEEDHEIAVLEMGMSGFGEIQRLAAITQPEIAVITNVGESHIENLGSQEGICKAKMEVAAFMKKDDLLILNGDDPFLKKATEDVTVKTFMTGESSKSDLCLKKYELNPEGSTFKVNYSGNLIAFKLQLPGFHSIQNALLAIGVGLQLGIDLDAVKKGIANYSGKKMRMQVYDLLDEVRVIDDVYNASPDSMQAALKVMATYEGWRKIAVLGDMLEMGTFGPEAHQRVGAMAFDSESDLIVLYGDMMKYAVKGAEEAGAMPEQVLHFEERERLAEYLRSMIQPKTVFLFKGSRGMEMEYFINQLKERVK